MFQVSLRECVSKAKCEKHYWHVSGSMVMCARRIGRARGVAAKVVDLITALMGSVLDICGVQRAGLHEAVETVVEVVGRQLGAQPTGFAEGIENEGRQVRAGWAAVSGQGTRMRGLCRLGTTLFCGEAQRRLPTTSPTKGVEVSLVSSAG